MKNSDFAGTRLTTSLSEPVSVSWRSPSNIAFVKYWGKYGQQLPVNPSLSMTLSQAYTETKLTALPRSTEGIPSLDFWFHGQKHDAFGKKMSLFLGTIIDIFPWLAQVNLKLDTLNTFPHSAGIASSASAFSALALCLCSLDSELNSILLDEIEFRFKASYVARLGSGSACRSVFPGLAVWGLTEALPGSSDQVAVPVSDIHPDFNTLCDTILIVNKAEKSVSSSEGHSRMIGHPYAEARIRQAGKNIAELLDALKTGDRKAFIKIVENEALSLHALMMTSDNGFMLMDPETVRIINRIQAIRNETNLDICFTLDAGPNVHVIYFKDQSEQINKLIVEDISKNNKQNIRIDDYLGFGPIKLV